MKIQRGDQLTKEEMKWYMSFNSYLYFVYSEPQTQRNLHFFGFLFICNEIVDFTATKTSSKRLVNMNYYSTMLSCAPAPQPHNLH